MATGNRRIVNPALELATRAQLLQLQESRLLAQVHRCYQRIPYYRRRWPAAAGAVSSLAEFRDIIPFLSKPDLLTSDEETFSERVANPGSPVYSLHLTSGTSGIGQEVHPLTLLDHEAMGSTWIYQAYWAGLEIGDAFFYTFPVGMQTGGLWSGPASEKMASLGFHMGPYPSERKLDYLLRFRPHGMAISPAYLTRLQALLEQRGINPREALANLKSIFIAGENYSLEWAHRALDFWGCNISEWYGCMQGGLNLSFSCEHGIAPEGRRGILHSMEHRVLCEVLHPETNQAVAEGEEGEMVITTLFREAFPVVRFRTGDRVRFMGNRCSCGRPFAGIEAGTVARYDDMMKIRGQNLWPDAVDKLVFANGDVEEYAGVVAIDAQGRETVEIRLEFNPRAAIPGDQQARRISQLTQEIHLKLNVRMSIRRVDYLSLPRYEFKVRRWTDNRRTDRQVVRYVKLET